MNMVFQVFLLLLVLSVEVIILRPNMNVQTMLLSCSTESGTFQIFSIYADFHYDWTCLPIFFYMEGKFHPCTKELEVFLVWAGIFGCKLPCITSNQNFCPILSSLVMHSCSMLHQISLPSPKIQKIIELFRLDQTFKTTKLNIILTLPSPSLKHIPLNTSPSSFLVL